MDNLIVALFAHETTRNVRVSNRGAGEKEPQEVINFSDRSNCGSGIAAHRFLLDGNHWREPVDKIDIWALHHPEKLPCISAQAFNVPALPLCVDRIKR